ncbi:hypothetical protein GCM10009746_10640 [Microbacterium paludicola]
MPRDSTVPGHPCAVQRSVTRSVTLLRFRLGRFAPSLNLEPRRINASFVGIDPSRFNLWKVLVVVKQLALRDDEDRPVLTVREPGGD